MHSKSSLVHSMRLRIFDGILKIFCFFNINTFLSIYSWIFFLFRDFLLEEKISCLLPGSSADYASPKTFFLQCVFKFKNEGETSQFPETFTVQGLGSLHLLGYLKPVNLQWLHIFLTVFICRQKNIKSCWLSSSLHLV